MSKGKYANPAQRKPGIRELGCLALLFSVSVAFSQEAIKFQIPTDSAGTPVPVALPQKPDTVQKLGVVSNLPLNLVELSIKDTAGFETYTRRLALLQDSISATYRAIDHVKKNTVSFMPPLEPKGEFEKQAEYEARKDKWDKELFDRTERDTKSHAMRLADLQKAKKKIEENQASLYSSVNIKSSPESASIWIGKEEIGATPADYDLLIPGTVKISVRKEGYNPWDTTFQAVPGAKFKIYAALEEKSIFSTENEIDFVKTLSKNTTVEGYEARIKIIEARKVQVGEEIKKILEDFASSYPALEPQKPDETPEAFNKRRDIWTKEGMRQVAEFQKKHDVYRQKLDRSIAVLKDYIIITQSTIISEPSLGTKIELGSYDAEKEQFELVAQDSASEKSPFLFKGHVGVPRDTAKSMDRSVPGFVANLQFINYPFKTDSLNVNLGMSKLLLSKSGLDLKVEGSFGEIERYKSVEGYDVWKLHADSLLSGSLKSQGFDYNYAMGKAAVKEVADKDKGKEEGSGLGWRGWTRIVTFTAAVALGGLAVYNHVDAQDNKKEMDKLKDNMPDLAGIESWTKKFDGYAKDKKDSEDQRLIFGIGAGVFALGGVATFFF
ncbi:MAG: PEGA domain-containing protein [Candidatus Fibromonas sp.]|jgi:hypothetical protein|nr:PEGA domain-containing protein [Candidatus Fibromonas sp.]